MERPTASECFSFPANARTLGRQFLRAGPRAGTREDRELASSRNLTNSCNVGLVRSEHCEIADSIRALLQRPNLSGEARNHDTMVATGNDWGCLCRHVV